MRLEWHPFTTGVSRFAAKLRVIREAVCRVLTRPTIGYLRRQLRKC